MTTPQISRKYHFQANLKGLHLPVTFTIPDMPDSPPFEEPLGPSHSWIVPDKDSQVTETATQRHVITDTPSSHTDPRETDSHFEDVDILSHLSVSTSYSVRLLLSDIV